MSIVIYSYHDPYRLKDNKELWEEIIACPYFCVSQTLVNGLKSVYGESFRIGRVTTVSNLQEALYEKWTSTSCAVKQHADIDNIISSINEEQFLTDAQLQNIKKSFVFNRDEVLSSIRTMFELNINPQNIVDSLLTPEQRFIVAVYNIIINSNRQADFQLGRDFSEKEIDDAIKLAMNKAIEKASSSSELSVESMDSIVIHGVHQFSPLLLRVIEEVSKYKKVILLFNYQSQFKNIYQTWIDIYTAFDCKMVDYSGQEYYPSDVKEGCYEGNMLAQNMGKLLEGRKDDISISKPYEIIEFDNMTEFANYVARVFEEAEKKDPGNPMSAMKEQIYAADSSANDILKIYFPDQFGERQFLNYPLGHFFIAVANMWDSETNGIAITDLNDIKEALSAGILAEKKVGGLIATFERMSSLFDGCSSIDEMLSRIKKVKTNKKYTTDEKRIEYLGHISYFDVSNEDVTELEVALNDLDELASFFYEDFEKRPNNFKEFYRKLKQYLQEEIAEDRNLSEEFEDIINRVLERLDEVENINASASFECLRSTMSLYLVQETKPGKSANWIVRDFEQIDGDVLRTSHQKSSVLHFACLTDEDIDSVKRREFSWPLNADFFEVAQNPVDWKYQVFVKARKEYKNFKRYALVFGLEFNRGRYKLSFVKRDGDHEREPYYLLKILGLKLKRNIDWQIQKRLEPVSDIQFENHSNSEYSKSDYDRYRICKKKFLLETLAEGNTVYKDSFLLSKYLEVWVENEVKENLQGLPGSELILVEKINELYDELKKYFPFALNVNRIDIMNNVKNRLKGNSSFPVLSDEDRRFMMIRELFIYKQLKNPKKYNQDILKDKFVDVPKEKVNEALSRENVESMNFSNNPDLWCKYCCNRELCLAFYATLE